MTRRFIIALFGTLLILSHFSSAEAQSVDQTPAKVSIIPENDHIRQGQPFWIAIKMTLDKGWHAYWKNPGDAGMGPMINWTLPEGFTVTQLQWPTPKKYTLNEAIGYGYEDELILLAEVTPPNSIQPINTIAADLRWVVCNDASCQPGNASLSLEIPSGSATPQTETRDLFNKARSRLPKSPPSVEAIRKDHLITLKVESHIHPTKAQFFPEEQEMIDPNLEAIITHAEGLYYYVVVKENESLDSLKGVLTLSSQSGDESYEIDVSLLNDSPIAMLDREPQKFPSQDSASDQGFTLALAFAFLGGLILNLMPCVLPVISFKVLSFVKMANQERSLIFKHGLSFSAGVLLSFWTLAAVLLILQAYGRSVGWGFQLQEPLFVAILAAIIFVAGLSMLGVFEMGSNLAALAGQTESQSPSSGLRSSFFSGVLATAVATPCTGPFLGTAVGFAVGLPMVKSMMIFTFIGLGMAFPYLLLGAFPNFLKHMPKPGNWMISFKEAMGFVMLGTVLWLLWVFGAQTDSTALTILLFGFFFLSISCWIYGKWGTPAKKSAIRKTAYALTLLFVLISGTTIHVAASWDSPSEAVATESGWIPFSSEKVAELRKEGKPILIDFTAKWCLVCQANHLVLSTGKVSKELDNRGVIKMKADWTKYDPAITEELKKFGRNSVPLYLMYGTDPDSPPTILPQVLTPDIVLNHLE